MHQGFKLPILLTIQHLQNPGKVQVEEVEQVAKGLSQLSMGKLKLHAQCQGQIYSNSFVSRYLLIKLNSLSRHSTKDWSSFIQQLTQFYNGYISQPNKYQFRGDQGDASLISQILLASHTHKYLTEEMLDEILDSSGMIVTTMAQTYFRVQKLINKSQFVVTLGLVSLFARTNPFVPIVHQDKNHKGQCQYAARIYQLIHLHPDVKTPKEPQVQDAYSLRCTPHAHGVVYDCLSNLQQQLSLSLNKPQTRFITVNSKKVRNLAFRCQTETLVLDSLVCSVNEIGHMSFLRTQRILNRFLTKNNISQKEYYPLLMIKLKKASLLLSQNKLLASPTNTETVIMDNYTHDVYCDEGTPYLKALKMVNNVQSILKGELFASTDVLSDIYHQAPRLFLNDQIENVYHQFNKAHKEGMEMTEMQIQRWWQQ